MTKPPAAVSPGPSAQFEPRVLDLGQLPTGVQAESAARLRNVSMRPLRLLSFESGCDCTAVDVATPRVLRSGDAMDVPVRLDLSHLLGGGLPSHGPDPVLLRRDVRVKFEGAEDVVLAIQASITRSFGVEPAAIDLGRIAVGETAEAAFTLSPVSMGRPRLVARGTPLPLLHVEPAADHWSGTLRWGPLAYPGDREAAVVVELSAPPRRFLIPVRARVRPLAWASPASVDEGDAVPGQALRRFIRLERADGVPAQVDSVNSSTTWLRARFVHEQGSPGLEILVVGPPPGGRVEGHVTVVLKGAPPVEVVIPVRVVACPTG